MHWCIVCFTFQLYAQRCIIVEKLREELTPEALELWKTATVEVMSDEETDTEDENVLVGRTLLDRDADLSELIRELPSHNNKTAPKKRIEFIYSDRTTIIILIAIVINIVFYKHDAYNYIEPLILERIKHMLSMISSLLSKNIKLFVKLSENEDLLATFNINLLRYI